jgi:hypothetical protein
MQVLLRDRLPALLKVGEHLGMWSDKFEGPKEENPLEKLLREIQGIHGAGSTLPVVHRDPEVDYDDVQDVAEKNEKPAPDSAAPKPVRQRWKKAS